ncbi:hypothetical protein KSP40_PGU015026 [Platanthera guangdongensis]|uniref:Uncharacterized protein n=1 Tax=Platanthera guangdongensis TaxID=2320717 RepID=A0ABR2LR57_9ASPA
MARDRAVNPDCPNASNPFHICAEYCPRGSPPLKTRINREALVPNGVGTKEKGEKLGGVKRTVDPLCVNASNPFHQCADYCSRRSSHDGQSPSKGVKIGGTKETVVAVDNRKVNPSCPNASNPFHQCAEYCSQRTAIQKKQGSSAPGSSRGSANLVERKNVNRDCVNASNPFHKCTEYCSQTRRIS